MAVIKCKMCGGDMELTADKTTVVTKEATCEEDGEKVHTATVVVDGVEYTDTKEVVIPATGHDYEAEYIWSADGQSCEVKLTCDCGATETKVATVVEDTTKRVEPTCDVDGKAVYTATVVVDGVEYTDTKEVVIPATGHADNNGDGKCDNCGEMLIASLLGDVNNDGEVNTKDIVRLRKYFADPDVTEIHFLNSDVNLDGEVNTKDLVRMRKHFADGVAFG